MRSKANKKAPLKGAANLVSKWFPKRVQNQANSEPVLYIRFLSLDKLRLTYYNYNIELASGQVKALSSIKGIF